ncbi:hypothetical protein FACS1894151_05860 [Spirochaetia bacterium]|nr:hypothetical protein FACS1894151_05860 [Spirochaetia bacterium]
MYTKHAKYLFSALIITLVVLFVSCASLSGSAAGSSADSKSTNAGAGRQKIYMSHLTREGYAPTIDEDGDILFKVSGKSYYIIISKNNPDIVTLLYPNIYKINTEQQRTSAADAVSYVNRNAKVAKAYISSADYVNIALELLIKNPDDFALLFSRMMQLIENAKDDFSERI